MSSQGGTRRATFSKLSSWCPAEGSLVVGQTTSIFDLWEDTFKMRFSRSVLAIEKRLNWMSDGAVAFSTARDIESAARSSWCSQCACPASGSRTCFHVGIVAVGVSTYCGRSGLADKSLPHNKVCRPRWCCRTHRIATP